MAFVRKRGECYYLVHNIRQKGHVRQVHLACLGRRPRISEEVIRQVTERHPFVHVDWQGLKQRLSQQIVRPEEMGSGYLEAILASARSLNLDIAGLHFPSLETTFDREMIRQLVAALKLLRTTVDVKLRSGRLYRVGEAQRRGSR